MNNSLTLGVARQIITPKLGCQLYGYDDKLHSSSVHDELTATAFYFSSDEHRAMLISITVCLINTKLSDKIRAEISARTGIPESGIFLSATHTHSGPNTCGSTGWGRIDEEYCNEIFIPRVIDTALCALKNPVPVKMGASVGHSNVGINRRQLKEDGNIYLGQDPDGYYDPKMTILSFMGEHGVVANLVHYGAHGTAAGYNEAITRDWSGIMTDRIEQISGAITAFFNGPEGDVGPRLSNGETTGDISHVEDLGKKAALDAERIYGEISSYDNIRLGLKAHSLCLPLLPRKSRNEAENGFLKYQNETTNLNAQKRHYYSTILSSYDDGYVDKENDVVCQSALILGDFVFLDFPFELFSEIGASIDEQISDKNVLSLSNTNGSESYLATEAELPRGGYEVNMFLTSHIQQYAYDVDKQIIKQCVKFLKGE